MRIFSSVPKTGLVKEQKVLQLLLDRLKSREFQNLVWTISFIVVYHTMVSFQLLKLGHHNTHSQTCLIHRFVFEQDLLLLPQRPLDCCNIEGGETALCNQILKTRICKKLVVGQYINEKSTL